MRPSSQLKVRFDFPLQKGDHKIMKGTRFWDRAELYDEVWQKPVTKLARTYGISDVGLAKVCRRLKVPLPGRGYWATPEYRRPRRPALPDFSGAPEITKPTDRATDPRLDPQPHSESELIEIAQVERLDRLSFTEPEPSALEPHELVERTRRALTRGSSDTRKVVRPRARMTCLDVEVSRQNVDRALAIFSRLLAILHAEGFSVTVAGTDHKCTSVRILDQDIQFGLAETIRTVRPEAPKANQYRSYFDRPAPLYEPSGALQLQIWNQCGRLRKRWRDSKHRQLEQQLYRFVAGMIRVAQAVRREAEEHRRALERFRAEEVFRQKRHQELLLLKGLIEAEDARVRRLEDAARNWVQAKQIREYVIALVRCKTSQGEKLSLGTLSASGHSGLWIRQIGSTRWPLLRLLYWIEKLSCHGSRAGKSRQYFIAKYNRIWCFHVTYILLDSPKHHK
jgi:hypothetical protein